jgi:hypothetical protein
VYVWYFVPHSLTNLAAEDYRFFLGCRQEVAAGWRDIYIKKESEG